MWTAPAAVARQLARDATRWHLFVRHELPDRHAVAFGGLSLEVEIDGLYALPLNEFTAARDALAKHYRDVGERAVASQIKELEKPTVSAWLVNQLARQRQLDVRRLINTGAELERAQRAAIVGGDKADFADTRREGAEVIQRLLDAAREIARSSGRPASESVLRRVGANLRAAAATAEGREALDRGRLARDLDLVGFDALSGIVPSPQSARPRRGRARATPTRKPPSSASAAQKRVRELQAKEQAARSAAQRLTQEWRKLDREAQQADQLAQKKRRAADEAQTRAQRAKQQSERFREQLATHRKRN